MSITDTGPFGFGPFTDGLTDNPPHPPGLGYGSLLEPESSATYGFSPYGGSELPRPAFPISGGYGGDEYGNGPYGSELDLVSPVITGALSLDGFRVEVFFSETMKTDAGYFNPANYGFVVTTGGVPVTPSSIDVGITAQGGANSVIVTHSGTTLGGVYEITLVGLVDTSDNLIEDGVNLTTVITRGYIPTLVVTPTSGTTVLLDFDTDLLTEAERSGGTGTLTSYGVVTSYPVPIVIQSVAHPVGDLSEVELTLQGMTSTSYSTEISPATAVTYDATVVPSADSGFDGTEVGTGSSTINAGLLLTKNSGVAYGWNFAESPNTKIIPSSTFQCDLNFNASAAVVSPTITGDALFGLHVCDGAVQATLTFQRSGTADTITVTSGDYSATVFTTWSVGLTTVSWLRNDQADIYTLVVNGVPLLSAPFTGAFGEFPNGAPVIPPGAQVVLGSTYQVTQFLIADILFTSSQTIFTNAWNFLHGLLSPFTGSAALALDVLLTQHGPVVKDWGSMEPACVEDVTVTVNGTPVTVSEINPYIGKITLETPIPRTPPGTTDVEVDYTWFPNPVFPLRAMNTPGLVYNKWDRRAGRNTTSVPPLNRGGADDLQRFPYSVVYGCDATVCQPLHIGHRYIGFEKEYTASLNSPNTLLYNQRKFGSSKSYARADSESESITLEFGGLVDEWEIIGDTTVTTNEASYGLQDASADEPGFVSRFIDLSTDSRFSTATRLSITDYALDGVWTGVGFGVHDNRCMFFVGALVINGLEHVGILLDSHDPASVSSWLAGPFAEAEITNSTTAVASTEDVPATLEAGDQFQITSGSQAGTYIVSSVVREATSTYITITTTFPADPGLFGNRDVVLLIESRWSDTSFTWQLDGDTETRDLLFSFGGSNSGVMVVSNTITLATPDDFAVDPGLRLHKVGELVWGSFARTGTNVTDWTLLRLESAPKTQATFSRGTVHSIDFDEFTSQGWFATTPFGVTEVTVDNELEFRAIAASETRDVSFGYIRTDPFISTKDLTVFQSRFRVDSWTSGAGDAALVLRDTKRDVQVGTLAYRESGTRTLIQLPFTSLSSVGTIEDQNWTLTGDLAVEYENPFVDFSTTVLATGKASGEITGGTESSVFPSKVLVARLAVQSWTALASGQTGLAVQIDAGSPSRQIGITWYDTDGVDPPRLALVSDTTVVSFVGFDWTDGAQHTYEIDVNATTGVVTLTVDNIVLTTSTVASFSDPAITGSQVAFRSTLNGPSFNVRLRELSGTIYEPADTLKTIGVYLGGVLDDINNWKIPRSDITDLSNSDVGAVVVPMDWSQPDGIHVRLHLDPTFGLVVERPDIPLPPTFDENFATQGTNPSRGWIVVEYARLLFNPSEFGAIGFGSFATASLSDQKWFSLFYRIYTELTEDYVAPYHQVYNQYNVITSGEINFDTTPEVVVVQSVTSTIVSLKPSHIYASRVFTVMVGSTVLAASTWEFDPDSQIILLSVPLSDTHVPVTVVFAPGEPVTTTYLEAQPLKGSTTLLNEGTPPFPKSQIQGLTSTLVSSSAWNDTNDTYNDDPDFLYNDPLRSVAFENDPDLLYENLEFFEITNDGCPGFISTICDGPAPGEGWSGIEIEGRTFTGQAPFFQRNLLWEGGGPVGAILHTSGGSPNIVGLLNQAVMYPNAPSSGPQANKGTGINVPWVHWDLRLSGSPGSVTTASGDHPLIEDFSSFLSGVDEASPSGPITDDPNPSAAPITNGAARYTLETLVSSFPKLGPFTGLDALTPDSLLYGTSTDQPTGIPVSGMGLLLAGGAPIDTTTIIVSGVLSN